MSSITSSFKKSDEELASHYALQVALQAMKERCQQLQTRLSAVEDENLKLKIEKQRSKHSDHNSLCEMNNLYEQISELRRHKSHLTHHICMVASENKYLWTQLSILTQANESLGTKVIKISSALDEYSNKSEKLLQEVYPDKQSLEEISLKLISNVQNDKSNSNKQFPDMIDLKSFKDCDFNMTNGESHTTKMKKSDVDNDLYDSVDIMEYYKDKLEILTVTVQKQNTIFNSIQQKIRMYSEGLEECRICKRNKSYCDAEVMVQPNEIVEKDLIDVEIQNLTNNTDKRSFCPICLTYSNVSKDDLADHVLEHFPPGEIKDDDKYYSFCSDHPPSVF